MKSIFAGILVLCLTEFTSPAASDDVTFRDEVRLVEVYATVFEHGRAVNGLTREQFEIRDDGKPQDIRVFESNDKSLSCVLLLDTTGSMRDSIPELRNAARNFIAALRPDDSVGVYAFTSQLEELQPPTTDKAAARRALMRLRAAGRTALFDSLSELALQLANRPGKKVIIVLTDGGDNASVLNRRSAETAASKRGIPVFAIAQGDALHDNAASGLLRELSQATGGRMFKANSSHDTEAALQAIANDLQYGYLLAFPMPREEKEVAWHELQISVKDTPKPLQVRARTGYSQ